MRKFHSIAALCGDGLRPEWQALFARLAIDPRSELFVRDDGMVQAGPDPASETVLIKMVPLIKKLPESELESGSAEGRGRHEDFSSPPAQIPACAANAPGSSLGSDVVR